VTVQEDGGRTKEAYPAKVGRWWRIHFVVLRGTDPLRYPLVLQCSACLCEYSVSQIVLDRPVRILPRGKRAFYLHSGLPDDLGIQYQSYSEDDIVAEDEHVLVWPGLGHTVRPPPHH
jgi:hypothetical protein